MNAAALDFWAGLSSLVRDRAEAEREGFEPSRELAPPTRLAGECLQPLGHLSGVENHSAGLREMARLVSKL
jgi:hypothetical protein